MARPRKNTSITTRIEADRPAPIPQHAIPDELPEALVRHAVLAYRKAGPLGTLLINYAMQLPLQSGASAKATRDELRLLLDRMEGL